MSAEVQRINTLTSLRFFAALMIILGHTTGTFFKANWLGYFSVFQGVSFFFVLSGFILTHIYSDLCGKDVLRFYLARFARIWPAHITALVLLIVMFYSPDFFSQKLLLLSNVAMVHAWIPNVKFYFSYNAPSWSISTEMFFYLCFPLLIYRWRKTWKIKLLISFSVMLATIILYNKYVQPTKIIMDVHWLIYINPISRIFEFMLGMTFALGYKYLRDRNLSFIMASVYEILILICIFIGLRCSIHISIIASKIVGIAGKEWLAYSSTCFWFACLILITSVEKGLLSRFLSLKPLIVLGEISYSLYLFHTIFGNYCANHYQWALKHHPVISYVVFWSVILAVSYFTWKYIERPIRIYINLLPDYIAVRRKNIQIVPAEM